VNHNRKRKESFSCHWLPSRYHLRLVLATGVNSVLAPRSPHRVWMAKAFIGGKFRAACNRTQNSCASTRKECILRFSRKPRVIAPPATAAAGRASFPIVFRRLSGAPEFARRKREKSRSETCHKVRSRSPLTSPSRSPPADRYVVATATFSKNR